jgi:hypothetical protein
MRRRSTSVSSAGFLIDLSQKHPIYQRGLTITNNAIVDVPVTLGSDGHAREYTESEYERSPVAPLPGLSSTCGKRQETAGRSATAALGAVFLAIRLSRTIHK